MTHVEDFGIVGLSKRDAESLDSAILLCEDITDRREFSRCISMAVKGFVKDGTLTLDDVDTIETELGASCPITYEPTYLKPCRRAQRGKYCDAGNELIPKVHRKTGRCTGETSCLSTKSYTCDKDWQTGEFVWQLEIEDFEGCDDGEWPADAYKAC